MSAFLLGIGFRADMGTCARKLVLLKLIDACEDDGSRIFPAIATVARAAQCSTRQVQRELKSFLDAGLIRLVREGGKGPRNTNEYAMDIDMLHRLGRDGWASVTTRDGDASDEVKGDTVSPLENADKGDTGDSLRVTPETDKGDIACHPTPPDSSKDPSGARERASAEEPHQPETAAPADQDDTPGTAGFQKRVMRFCSGKGFAAGPWKDWDASSPGWIGKQFAALSTAERLDAERWRDPYLLDIAGRKKSPVTVGVFLRDRMWTGLDPMILDRAEKQRSAQLAPEERAQPEGWANCLGPVGMAYLFGELLAGQAEGRRLPTGMVTDPRLREAWPNIYNFRLLVRQKGGAVFGARWHALKGVMQPVPKGSDALEAWKHAFEERGWLWLSEFDRLDVVFCPAGGPEGLEAFAQATCSTREAAE